MRLGLKNNKQDHKSITTGRVAEPRACSWAGASFAEMLLTARWVEVPGCVRTETVQHDASISTDRRSPPQAWRDSTLVLSSSLGERDPLLPHRVGESVH